MMFAFTLVLSMIGMYREKMVRSQAFQMASGNHEFERVPTLEDYEVDVVARADVELSGGARRRTTQKEEESASSGGGGSGMLI
mmetsp:Transcript_27226/g.41798  ORF Transcript_27226/g.41798 Transcript_27226/m.41798 type:complete len:83 (-) Transcript_27226:107-355(-)|eukprot:CAMPEP_0118695566 /NCGR_PEP_ID=MMETSP0800-20121206/13267_1 /TAXON_ID=210618 ORGANISM="Striatella unipunctata, Strain CCMP2910" /NCGR_SAMPLE_ID=MMETSP0800 /ASSEMBLY_ACC=CAM_ASM_000638 /LENGTH=82 /DNA_ID=CAMNT_0006594391 /DNA_START=335 /DNA_END=583 /DNA_ORIENTATION=+